MEFSLFAERFAINCILSEERFGYKEEEKRGGLGLLGLVGMIGL